MGIRARGQSAPGTPLAAAPVQAPTGSNSFAGVNTTPPPAPVNGSGTNILASLQGAQNQANAANAQRYTQGLGVLSNTATTANNQTAQGYNNIQQGGSQAQAAIQQAINNSNTFGQTALTQVQQQLQNAQGSSLQSAVGRGLGNTTITDSLAAQNQRTANLATENIQEQQANRLSALNLNQANQYASTGSQLAGQSNQQASTTSRGGTDVAGFISGANNNAPNVGQYAQLMQAAGSANAASQAQSALQQQTAAGNLASFTGNTAAQQAAGKASAAATNSANAAQPTFFGASSGGAGGSGGAGASGGYGGGTGGSISSAVGGAGGSGGGGAAGATGASYAGAAQPAPSSNQVSTPANPNPLQWNGNTLSNTGQSSSIQGAGGTQVTPLPDASSSAGPNAMVPVGGGASIPYSQWAQLTPAQQRQLQA